ncbi:hypothetical protein WJX72_010008 [[Myrmecia] bisecta]|uniref:beta-galactoside alpha-(2,6)-sialyltransferase n=1 Tax=[Myrmecia] bisecta TaxID=41462 RepID=A0AAW1Q854_9CHLO
MAPDAKNREPSLGLSSQNSRLGVQPASAVPQPVLPRPAYLRWAPLPKLWDLLSVEARLAADGVVEQPDPSLQKTFAKPPPLRAEVLRKLALPGRIEGLLKRKVNVVWSQAAALNGDLDQNYSCGGRSIMSFNSSREIVNADLQLASMLPKEDKVKAVALRSCAVVGNSGSLLGAAHGPAIDSHDTVIRFNAAPTTGYEADVGHTTAFRLQNCDHIGFHEPQDEILIASVRNAPDLRRFAQQMWKPGAEWQFMFHPEFWCHVWDWVAHRKLKPTSGLAGVVLALHLCTPPVDLYGFQHDAAEFHYWNKLPDKVTKQDVYEYHPLQEEAYLYQELQNLTLVRLWP